MLASSVVGNVFFLHDLPRTDVEDTKVQKTIHARDMIRFALLADLKIILVVVMDLGLDQVMNQIVLRLGLDFRNHIRALYRPVVE